MIPAHFHTMATYSIVDMSELSRAIASLYGPSAKCSFVMNDRSNQVTALVDPKPGIPARYPKADNWPELIDAVESDADAFVRGHRVMTAEDIGVDA